MNTVRSILRMLNRAAIAICAVAILSMTVLGGVDVITTALWGKPIPGVYEMTETLMVFTVFLSLGYLHQERAYIAVDAAYEHFGPRVQRLADHLSLLLIATMFGLISWRAWGTALRSWEISEYSVGLIQFPIYPSKFAFAIGCTLLVISCLADLGKGRDLRMRGVIDQNKQSN
jgi:TRAP-type transport system small permease protein